MAYLQEGCGHDSSAALALAGEDQPLYCWASVHAAETSFHLLHVHRDAAVSGVFYARAGEGHDAQLIFDDPRGLSPHLSDRSVVLLVLLP